MSRPQSHSAGWKRTNSSSNQKQLTWLRPSAVSKHGYYDVILVAKRTCNRCKLAGYVEKAPRNVRDHCPSAKSERPRFCSVRLQSRLDTWVGCRCENNTVDCLYSNTEHHQSRQQIMGVDSWLLDGKTDEGIRNGSEDFDIRNCWWKLFV